MLLLLVLFMFLALLIFLLDKYTKAVYLSEFVLIVIVLLILGFFINLAIIPHKIVETITKEVRIEALSGTPNNNNFIMSSIESNGNMKYYFQEKNTAAGYSTMNMIEGLGENIRIIEKDNITKGKIITKQVVNKVQNNFGFDMNQKIIYEIIVPKGTIINSGYQVDIKPKK